MKLLQFSISTRPSKYLVFSCALILLGAGCQGQQPAQIIPLDKPFLFGYGTWDKKAHVDGGAIFLDVDGMTPKGGAGVNVLPSIALGVASDDCPALKLVVGPHNTLKTLKLMLVDTAGNSGTWEYALPAWSNSPVTLTPIDGAPFSKPNDPGKTGDPNLGKIMQWQMMGDWGGDGAVDVKVSAITAVAPNETITAERAARTQSDAAALSQAQKARMDARAQYGKISDLSPTVQQVYAAAPDIIGLIVHTGKITPSHLSDYTKEPGDTTKLQDGATYLIRNGKQVGYLIGQKKDGLVTLEGFAGDPLLTQEADDASNYTIQSNDDPNFARPVNPTGVQRKTKPDDWQQPKQINLTYRHVIYLRLPHTLEPGKTYAIELNNINVQQPRLTLSFHPDNTWSESVHVDQVGFRPDDPRKRAYLSLWTGSDGYTFAARIPFHLVDASSGRTVYSGHAGDTWPASKVEVMHTTRNFNGTDVTPLDFSDFKTPGRYRVVVDGVGCSYPFDIETDSWQKAFLLQMKGFYNQRGGIALGPPYSAFTRPADFHPGLNDCVTITQSTYSQLDGGDGQKGLAAGDTHVEVPGAWGGYHDAGDWNPRRITHMRTTTYWQLELMDLFPSYFKTLSLNIPKIQGTPDLLTECRFELDLFRRLQKPDGGVPFGIETNGDPIDGEVSWKQSMPAYVYAPDVQSSYIYVEVASRASRVLAPYDPATAEIYRETALKAMAWAENDRTKRQAGGTWEKLSKDVTEDRTLAALELYALTRDHHWHDIFMEDTTLKNADAPPFYGSQMRRDTAFLYARLPDSLADPTIKANAIKALVANADGDLAYQTNNAWGIASDDPGKPQFLGFYSNPHGAVTLLRAYTLTHDEKYLEGAIQASLFPAGANPNNMVYTSGVGENPVRHPLNLDSRLSGQAPPVGLTPYGNVDMTRWSDTWITWPITYYFGQTSMPNPTQWPTTEAYFDVFFMPALDEFCTDTTMGPNAYVWGYLAARK